MNNSILIAAVSVLFLILIIQILIIIASQVRSKKAFEILLQEEFKTQREFLDRSFSNLRSELTGLSHLKRLPNYYINVRSKTYATDWPRDVISQNPTELVQKLTRHDRKTTYKDQGDERKET